MKLRKREQLIEQRLGAKMLVEVLWIQLAELSAGLVGDEGEQLVNSNSAADLLASSKDLLQRYPLETLEDQVLVRAIAESIGYAARAKAIIDGATRVPPERRDAIFEEARYELNHLAGRVQGEFQTFNDRLLLALKTEP